MTKLTKPVSRELVRTCAQGRPIIVTLLPGDLVEFRQKGKRERFLIKAESLFWFAVQAHSQAITHARRTRIT